MPEEIATRATLLLMGGLVAGFGLMFLADKLWRVASGAADGQHVGMAAGLALFGAAMAWVVFDMASVVLVRGDQVLVRGEFEQQVPTTLRTEPRSGRELTGAAPVVSFRTPDGVRHEITGLSGSLQGLQPGDGVPVRVDPRNPAAAVIDDFQNLYGALWFFGLLAGVSLLAALHWAVAAVLVWREQRTAPVPGGRRGPRPPRVAPTRFALWRDGPRGQQARRRCRHTAVVVMVIGIASLFVMPDSVNVARIFANALAAVAVSLLAFGAAGALKPGVRPWMVFSGYVIAAFGVGGFAAMLWLLTAPSALL